MLSALIRSWWVVALRGLFAVLFGVLALSMPGITLVTLVALFGAWSIFGGAVALMYAMQHRERWWGLLLDGVAGVAAGALAFVWPGLTALAMLYIIAAWAVVSGVFQVVAAIRLREVIEGEALLALSGVASIAFGVLAAIRPGAGALGVVWLIGSYALLLGALLLALGLRLHGLKVHLVDAHA